MPETKQSLWGGTSHQSGPLWSEHFLIWVALNAREPFLVRTERAKIDFGARVSFLGANRTLRPALYYLSTRIS